MADFKEDYEEPFYQEVTAEESRHFPIFSREKKYRFYYVPFLVQNALLILIFFTEKSFFLPDSVIQTLFGYSPVLSICFLIAISLLTVGDIRKRKTPCYKVALPNVLIQTDLFFAILLCLCAFYSSSEHSYWALIYFIVPNVAFPVIPALIGILFVIGCFIDKKRAKKSRETKGEL